MVTRNDSCCDKKKISVESCCSLLIPGQFKQSSFTLVPTMAGATDAIRENVSIPTFFRGKSIFITGVTGFMGKVLLEKLLRSCPDLGLCYVLVRPKRGVQPKDRIKRILDCKVCGGFC